MAIHGDFNPSFKLYVSNKHTFGMILSMPVRVWIIHSWKLTPFMNQVARRYQTASPDGLFKEEIY